MTTNVTLWPQTLAVVANPDLDGRLTDAQRDWLRQAAERPWPLGGARRRGRPISRGGVRSSAPGWCGLPMRSSRPCEEAFAPVYADLRRDAETEEVPRPDPGS